MQCIFIYGTLRAGEANDISLAAARHGMAPPRLIGAASVRGRLYDFGSYPGLVIDAGAGFTRGDVYQIEDALVPVLDEIEEIYPGVDGLFKSSAITVEVAGAELRCLFYPIDAGSVGAHPRIENGDWVQYRLARDVERPLRYGS
ncbi:gamma-glutamylcyclotransferase [Trinickia sp. LjRoot230]|uniref:gamma-glutamylcyclotransferase family protein n=1 Tax=Trinickia sp. LjRoot230 TaxID=3342288 RepID=UPI003ECEE647